MVKSGDTLGDFVLGRELGRGSMGVVYEGRQVSLGRRVALKVLTPTAAGDPVWVSRFHEEASAAARLSHPGILPVFAVGEAEGLPYFAMELVEGQDLAAMVRNDGVVAPREAARIIRDAALALDHAHVQGVVHRDVKPGNVMVRRDGRVVVMDFGLAKQVGSSSLTATGTLVGTPYYMSPEQALGDRARIGPKSDVYGLGATLYELLTGRPPFVAENAVALLRMIAEKEPDSPIASRPEIPRDLETIVLCCMEKRPERRYPSCRALADDLDRFLRDEPISRRRPGPIERLRRIVEKNRVASSAIIAAVVLLAAGYFVFQHVLATKEADYREEIDRAIEAAQKAMESGDPEKALEALAPVAAAGQGTKEQQGRVNDVIRRGFKGALEKAKSREGGEDVSETVAGWRQRFHFNAGVLNETLPPAFVTVRTTPPDATATARPLGANDTGGAEPIVLEAPIVDRRVPLGIYLVTITAPGRVPVKLALALLEPDAKVAFDVALPTPGDVPSDMVYLGGQVARTTSRDGSPIALDVPPFLLDRTEVTVDAYVKFVSSLPPEERAAFLPSSWTGGRPPPDATSLPVTGVTWEMADGYAAWAKKRLPTEREFECAAYEASTAGRTPPRISLAARSGPQPNTAASASKGTLPVDRPDAFASPSGATDLLGNAAEWTASSPLGDPWGILVVGGSYEQALGPSAAAQLPTTSSPAVGFRCARSVPAAALPPVSPPAPEGWRRLRLESDGSIIETRTANGVSSSESRMPLPKGDLFVRLGSKFNLDVAAETGLEVTLPPGSVIGRTGSPFVQVASIGSRPALRVPPRAGDRLRLELVVPSAGASNDGVRDAVAAVDRLLQAMKARQVDAFVAGLAPEFVSEKQGDRAAVAAILAARPARGAGPAALDVTFWGAARQGDRVVVRHLIEGAEKRKPGALGPAREIMETYVRRDEASGRWLATYQATRRIPEAGAKPAGGAGLPEEGKPGK